MVTEQSPAQTCLDVDAVLGWLDGALSERRAADVEAHIDGCAVCRQVLSETVVGTPRDAVDPDPPPARLGPYEIRGVVGRGGMGEVYRAYDPRLDREVAIKMIRPYDRKLLRAADLDWFERETRTAAAISHPNVLAVFDVGHHRGVPYVVTELLAGESLRARLRRGPVATRQVVTWARDLAHGMAAAHDRGIVHRDLKPDNVFVCGDGRVKILDFGVATFLRGHDADDDFEEHGLVVGTLGYMAPEQLSGARVDHRTDVFAFGAVLYEMLAGKPAFAGRDEIEVAEATLGRDPLEREAFAEAPPAVVEIVRRCLQKKPDERFQSARDLAFALDTLGTEVSRRATVVPRRRWPFVAGVAVGALVAGLAAVVIIAARGSPARPQPAVVTKLLERSGQVWGARLAPDGTLYVSAALEDLVGSGALLGMRTYRRDAAGALEPVLGGPALVAAVAPNGNVTVLRELVLDHYVVRGRLQLVDRGGHELPLAGDAADVTGAGFLPDGSLAVTRNRGGLYQLEAPIGKVVFRSTGQLLALAVSPRGTLAVVDQSSVDAQVTRRVVAIAPSGGQTFIGGDWADATGLAWDGDELVVSGSRDGITNGVWRVDRDGRMRVVWRTARKLVLLDVARDGALIVSDLDVRRRIIVHNGVSGRTHEMLWTPESQLIDLSLDGTRLTFGEQPVGDPVPRLYVRSIAGGDPIAIGAGPGGAISPNGRHVLVRSVAPPWRMIDVSLGSPWDQLGTIVARHELPAGDITLFLSAGWLADDTIIMLASGANGPAVYKQALDGSPPHRLGPWTGGSAGFGVFRVAPDGKHISDREQNLVPKIIDLESFTATRVGTTNDVIVGWSRDSAAVFVAGLESWPVAVTRHPLDRATPLKLFEIPAPGPGTLMMEQLRVAGDGQTFAASFLSVDTTLLHVEPEGPR